MARYQLRYFFDWGLDCLWAANDEAKDRFGYPVLLDDLDLPVPTVEFANKVMGRWGELADGHARGEYDKDDAQFEADAQELLRKLRDDLGLDFDIVDESGTAALVHP